MHFDRRRSRPGSYQGCHGQTATSSSTDGVLARFLAPDARAWLQRHPHFARQVAEALSNAYAEGRAEGHAKGITDALTIPHAAIPAQLALALRRGDRTCQLIIAGTPVSVALHPEPLTDHNRELVIWQAIQHAYHEVSAQARSQSAESASHYLRRDLPSEVAALAWTQDGTRLYATSSMCRSADLRVLRAQQRGPNAPPVKGLAPILAVTVLGQRAVQAITQFTAAPSVAVASTVCAIAVVAATPPLTDIGASAPPGQEGAASALVHPTPPVRSPRASKRPAPDKTAPSKPVTAKPTTAASTPTPGPIITVSPTPTVAPPPVAAPTPTTAPEPAPGTATPTPTAEPSPDTLASPPPEVSDEPAPDASTNSQRAKPRPRTGKADAKPHRDHRKPRRNLGRSRHH